MFGQALLRRLPAFLANYGTNPDDSEDARLQKGLLVSMAVLIMLAAIVWGTLYLLLGEPVAASIPYLYAVVSFLSIIFFGVTRSYTLFRALQLAITLLLPFLLMLALGGFINSSAVILWSLLSPIGALVFADVRHVIFWSGGYLGLLVLSGLLQPYVNPARPLPPGMIIVFFVMNIGVVSFIALALLRYYVREKNSALRLLRLEQDRSENLLLNVLPREIAAVLKNNDSTIADHFDAASVLFADMVNFTSLSAKMPPAEMVDLLNEIYSHFDSLVDNYGLEKIRTIGDNYMVASGVPRPRPDHAQALARMALDIRDYILTNQNCVTKGLNFRIGINSGPVLAGVIGRRKFAYDVWGDTVNTASRMESHGTPGSIQITRDTYELLKDEFVCEPRGVIPVKGKGDMEVYYLLGEKEKVEA